MEKCGGQWLMRKESYLNTQIECSRCSQSEMLNGSQTGVKGWGKEGPEACVISFLISEGRGKLSEENVGRCTGSEWKEWWVEKGLQVERKRRVGARVGWSSEQRNTGRYRWNSRNCLAGLTFRFLYQLGQIFKFRRKLLFMVTAPKVKKYTNCDSPSTLACWF